MRKAKGTLELSDLLDELLSGLTYFDEIPRCYCPIPSFPYTQATSFCTTKCYTPCYHFRHFHFIVDECNVVGCTPDSPCPECLVKIDEFKVLMKGMKASLNFRMRERKQRGRCRRYSDQSNKNYKKIKRHRENNR